VRHVRVDGCHRLGRERLEARVRRDGHARVEESKDAQDGRHDEDRLHVDNRRRRDSTATSQHTVSMGEARGTRSTTAVRTEQSRAASTPARKARADAPARPRRCCRSR
jgi:hypothetical protein